jgi:hypothetical protein
LRVGEVLVFKGILEAILLGYLHFFFRQICLVGRIESITLLIA